jgi:hypothetical protein
MIARVCNNHLKAMREELRHQTRRFVEEKRVAKETRDAAIAAFCRIRV